MIVGARGQTDFSLLVLFPSYVERRRRRRRRPIHSPRRQLRRGDAARMSRIPAKTIRKKREARHRQTRSTGLLFSPLHFSKQLFPSPLLTNTPREYIFLPRYFDNFFSHERKRERERTCSFKNFKRFLGIVKESVLKKF